MLRTGALTLALLLALPLLARCGAGDARAPAAGAVEGARVRAVEPGGTNAPTPAETPPPPAATPPPRAATRTDGEPETGSPPAGLALPFRADDVDGGGGFFSPFGVVRRSQDRAEFGHSGIDIPLRHGAGVRAVADGLIVAVAPSLDGRPGSTVTLLIEEGGRPGEGWAFLYEHVTLAGERAVGSRVHRGEVIAHTPLHPLEANNHLQLTYLFNDYRYYRSHTCWAAQLAPDARAALQERFDSVRAGDGFISGWNTVEEEGAFAYRGLLDRSRFPDGPLLCYPPGTDVRTPRSG